MADTVILSIGTGRRMLMRRHAGQRTTVPAQTAVGDIQIQLRSGAMAVTIAWPVCAASDCAAWVRERLR